MSSMLSKTSPWKSSFTLFEQSEHNGFAYFDSAATCLIPREVAMAKYQYDCYNHANSHRGFYRLSVQSTEIVEQARAKVGHFIHANSPDEIIFSASTTDAINMIAASFAKHNLAAEKNIVISVAEHHANFLPWQQLCNSVGAQLRVANILSSGVIDTEHLYTLIDADTLLVAVSHMSNILGQQNPVKEITGHAQQRGAKVLIDGAQAIAHQVIDVQAIGCDFYVFSGHKCYAGSGIGILFARSDAQQEMKPSILGGGMVERVTESDFKSCSGPQRFEAGSRNVSAIVGLVAAIDFINACGRDEVYSYIEKIGVYLDAKLKAIPFIKPINVVSASSIVGFNIDQVHSHDVATWLDSENIAVRAGHHCAQPLHKFLGLNHSIRVSLGLYNDTRDIDKLIDALTNVHQALRIE